MTALSLRRATEADIPFIMETERKPGYDQFIGRYSLDEHRAQLTNPAFAYLIGENAEGSALGFVILMDLNRRDGNACVKRIAVSSPEKGVGTPLLAGAVDFAFLETNAHRLWLDVVSGNLRARPSIARSASSRKACCARRRCCRMAAARISSHVHPSPRMGGAARLRTLMELPAPLRSAVDQMLQGEPLERLAKASAILSDRYRREVRDGRFHIDDALAAKAYLATRMPATFAAVRAALAMVEDAAPDFQPETLIDLGCGPGTALWAAADTWGSWHLPRWWKRAARSAASAKNSPPPVA